MLTRREILLAALAPVLAACGGRYAEPTARWEAGDKRDLAVGTWSRRVIEGEASLGATVFLWLDGRTDDVRALDALCGCGLAPGGCPVGSSRGRGASSARATAASTGLTAGRGPARPAGPSPPGR